MKKVYLIRHGQTQWNAIDKICGRTDSPLTDKGIEQALELSKKIKHSGVHIDEIISSPLSRAVKTCEPTAKALNIPITVDNRLIEQDFGIFEGLYRFTPDFLKAKEDFDNNFVSGESANDVRRRVKSLLEDIKKADKIYLLSAHNGVARAMYSLFFPLTPKDYAVFNIENCKLIEFDMIKAED